MAASCCFAGLVAGPAEPAQLVRAQGATGASGERLRLVGPETDLGSRPAEGGGAGRYPAFALRLPGAADDRALREALAAALAAAPFLAGRARGGDAVSTNDGVPFAVTYPDGARAPEEVGLEHVLGLFGSEPSAGSRAPVMMAHLERYKDGSAILAVRVCRRALDAASLWTFMEAWAAAARRAAPQPLETHPAIVRALLPDDAAFERLAVAETGAPFRRSFSSMAGAALCRMVGPLTDNRARCISATLSPEDLAPIMAGTAFDGPAPAEPLSAQEALILHVFWTLCRESVAASSAGRAALGLHYDVRELLGLPAGHCSGAALACIYWRTQALHQKSESQAAQEFHEWLRQGSLGQRLKQAWELQAGVADRGLEYEYASGIHGREPELVFEVADLTGTGGLDFGTASGGAARAVATHGAPALLVPAACGGLHLALTSCAVRGSAAILALDALSRTLPRAKGASAQELPALMRSGGAGSGAGGVAAAAAVRRKPVVIALEEPAKAKSAGAGVDDPMVDQNGKKVTMCMCGRGGVCVCCDEQW